MTSNHFVKSLSILLLLIPLASAQSPADQSAGQADEQKKVHEERERKAAAIVEEVIKETQSLKLPENRIRIQIALTDVLWPRSEQRARALSKTRSRGSVRSLRRSTAKTPSIPILLICLRSCGRKCCRL